MMKEIPQAELAYWAGFIDGEGSIFIKKEKSRAGRVTPIYELALKVENTNKEVIERFFKTFQSGYKTYREKNGKNGKPLYGVTIKQQKALNILEMLEPFIIVKKKNIEIAKAFLNLKTEFHGKTLSDEEVKKREYFYQEMKKLNMRGR